VYSTVDAVIMGRKTHELSLGFDDELYPGTSAYVFSRTTRAPDRHARYVADDVAGFVRRLKDEPGRHVWLVGGGAIIRECLCADLIDEFVVSVHPVVLGAGIALFPPGFPRRTLRMQGVERDDPGLVQLGYARAR
jgi:dihydrofolate reductase